MPRLISGGRLEERDEGPNEAVASNICFGEFMNGQLEQRLAQLKMEAEAGQKMMDELDARRSQLRDTLMRISGAIQVLEELRGAKEDLQSDNPGASAS